MTEYTRAQVRASRERWISFMSDPSRAKAKGKLALDYASEQRCCLGHACQALDPEHRTGWHPRGDILPEKIADMLGMYHRTGRAPNRNIQFSGLRYLSLIEINDSSTATPQMIAAYLQIVIKGGPDTPFKPLGDYPE